MIVHLDNKFQMKFKKKIEFLVKHENQSLLSACEGGGVGRSMDLGESHGLKGERRRVIRRQQSMKGGGTKKLTANYLLMRRDHSSTTEPYKGIRSFYRYTTKIL